MSRRKLRELPGWDEATQKLCVATRPHDGSQYQVLIGQTLRVVGAFTAPPSVDHVTRDLVKCLAIGLIRQNRVGAILEGQREPSEPVRVISIANYRWQRAMRLQTEDILRRQLSGDWSDSWTGQDERGGDSTL